MSGTTAFLVIDVQEDLVRQCWQSAQVVERIAGLLGRARAAGAPVVYIQDNDVGEGAGSAGWQIHPAVAPAPGEPVVRKPGSDAFFQTNLADLLADLGVDHLVVAGMKTNVCVDSTSRRAIALGFRVTLAADAHSTTDNQVLSAEQTIAYHNDLLWGFGSEDGFGGGERWIEVAPADVIVFEARLPDAIGAGADA